MRVQGAGFAEAGLLPGAHGAARQHATTTRQHATAFFCFDVVHFAKIAGAVVGTFGVLWAPICVYSSPPSPVPAWALGEGGGDGGGDGAGVGCAASLLQVLRRLFPFGRGLFEDKVANVW